MNIRMKVWNIGKNVKKMYPNNKGRPSGSPAADKGTKPPYRK